MSSVRNAKRASSFSRPSTTGILCSFAFSILLEGSLPAIRKCVPCVMFSTTTPPCFVRISARTFLGISNVPVMQNELPASFPSITFFLRSKIEKLIPSYASCSSRRLLFSFENRIFSAVMVSIPIPLIDTRNSSLISRRSRSSIENFCSSLYHLALIASTMICAVFLPMCWIPKPFIKRRNGLFFDFFSSSAIR